MRGDPTRHQSRLLPFMVSRAFKGRSLRDTCYASTMDSLLIAVEATRFCGTHLGLEVKESGLPVALLRFDSHTEQLAFTNLIPSL